MASLLACLFIVKPLSTNAMKNGNSPAVIKKKIHMTLVDQQSPTYK
jgi:hypothetical protein